MILICNSLITNVVKHMFKSVSATPTPSFGGVCSNISPVCERVDRLSSNSSDEELIIFPRYRPLSDEYLHSVYGLPSRFSNSMQ